MVIIINGKRSTVRLQKKCTPQDFKKAMAGKGHTEILEYCNVARRKVDDLSLEMMKSDIPLTTEMLKDFFKKGAVVKEYTLKNLFEEYLSIQKKKVGKSLTMDTFNRYKKTTEMFLETNGLNENVPAASIKLDHFLNYQAELGTTLDPATSCNYLQKIKTIFKFAFETGKIPSHPAYLLKIDKGVKETVLYLTEAELKKIKTHKFGRRLQEIADVFVFSCYTGISFADIELLEKEDFQEKMGYTYIEKTRKKTGIKFIAILFEDALEIARKYNYCLPVKSSQKTNEYLKEIGEICGISKPLHFHMARHTAACYLINHRPAIPNETIMRIFGWKKETQLRHYAKIFNETVFADLESAGIMPQHNDEGKKDRNLFSPEKLDFFQTILDKTKPPM